MKKQVRVFAGLAVKLMLASMAIILLTGPGPAEANEAGLKEKTEQLYLNYKALDDLYGDLLEITGAYIYQADEQLNYMQKMALFINEARLICYYQWQMLSVMDYIKLEAIKDYYTLRHRDLSQAKGELTFILSLLDLYRAYIENKASLQPVNEAAANIEANVYMFASLIEILDALAK